MILSNESNSKKKKAKIISDAFPKNSLGENTKIAPIARIHKIIADKGFNIEAQTITYSPLSINDYEDLVDLHKEWFPIKYTKDFFERILKTKLRDLEVEQMNNKENEQDELKYKNNHEVINLGAYIVIDNHKYLIGCITVEIKSEEEFEYYSNSTIEYQSELNWTIMIMLLDINTNMLI